MVRGLIFSPAGVKLDWKGNIMYYTQRTRENILEMLAAGPRTLAELTAGLAPDQLTAPPAPGEWSARDVLGHLRACADMWGWYIERILREDHPTFLAVNPRTWIRKTDYLEIEFEPSLRAFTAQREGLVAVLRTLTSGSGSGRRW